MTTVVFMFAGPARDINGRYFQTEVSPQWTVKDLPSEIASDNSSSSDEDYHSSSIDHNDSDNTVGSCEIIAYTRPAVFVGQPPIQSPWTSRSQPHFVPRHARVEHVSSLGSLSHVPSPSIRYRPPSVWQSITVHRNLLSP